MKQQNHWINDKTIFCFTHWRPEVSNDFRGDRCQRDWALPTEQRPAAKCTPGIQVGSGINRHLTRAQWNQKEPAKVSPTTWASRRDSIWIRHAWIYSTRLAPDLQEVRRGWKAKWHLHSQVDCVKLLHSCRKTFETRGEPKGIQVTIQVNPPELLIKQKGSAPHPRDSFITRREAS